jgi:hypothetical protein
MKARIGIVLASAFAILAAASSNSQAVRRPIMPGDQQLPIQRPSHEYPPAPPIKFKSNDPAPKDTNTNTNNDQTKYEPKVQSHVSISDIIGGIRPISSFSSFSRLSESTSALLADLSTNTTVLAPLNSAIDQLPRKPWESPSDYQAFGSQAYDGTGGQDRANKNIAKFVEAHLVKKSPWAEGEKVQTLAGRELWWELKNGERVIMPDRVSVQSIPSRASNGEVVSCACLSTCPRCVLTVTSGLSKALLITSEAQKVSFAWLDSYELAHNR